MYNYLSFNIYLILYIVVGIGTYSTWLDFFLLQKIGHTWYFTWLKKGRYFPLESFAKFASLNGKLQGFSPNQKPSSIFFGNTFSKKIFFWEVSKLKNSLQLPKMLLFFSFSFLLNGMKLRFISLFKYDFGPSLSWKMSICLTNTLFVMTRVIFKIGLEVMLGEEEKEAGSRGNGLKIFLMPQFLTANLKKCLCW